MHLARCFLFVSLLVTASCGPALCQTSEAPGIDVGIPKAFDNRTLNLMLDDLNESLVRVNVIDQKTLSQAIGTTQGFTLQETDNSLTIQGGINPGIASKSPSSGKAGGTASNGDTGTAAGTPVALPKSQYSVGASDLLNEQVDLMYQIFNLRMLIDRSLSDRLLSSPGNPKDPPRLQTVIGLNVTIDPPRDAEKSAAIVEVTLYRDEKSKPEDRPSLVSVMPQEHTYNSAALSSKSFAFGGSAVAKIVSVGYTTTRRGQTYYLFRDNDTVSFEKPIDPSGNSITFGWEFRPVLGRRSVAPGMRQMFAVISLPIDDSYSDSDQIKRNPRMIGLKAKVSCRWTKYDPGSLTTATAKEIRPWDKVRHVLSLGTTLTYPPKSVSSNKLPYDIKVPLTAAYLNDLDADIKAVSWHPVGATQAVIAVRGQNFFANTKIAIGDKLLNGSNDGLSFVSDQSLAITTSVSALATDAAILGRYGPAKPLQVDGSKKGPLFISDARFSELMGGYSEISLSPRFGKSDSSACLERADLEDDSLGNPIVFVNSTPLGRPYEFPLERGSDHCLQVVARVPQSLAKDPSGLIMLKFPFRRDAQASFRSYAPDLNFRSHSLGKKVYLLEKVDGAFVRAGQTDAKRVTAANWRVIVGGSMVPLQGACGDGEPKVTTFCLLTPNDNFARLSIVGSKAPTKKPPSSKKGVKRQVSDSAASPGVADAEAAPEVVLLQYGPAGTPGAPIEWNATYIVSLASAKEASPKANLDKDQGLEVNQYDEVWKSFKGQGLTSVDEVMVGSTRLRINPAEDGKSISVFLPLTITEKPAKVDLTFLDKQAHQIGTSQIRIKKTESGKE